MHLFLLFLYILPQLTFATKSLKLELFHNDAVRGGKFRDGKMIWTNFANDYLLTNMTLGSPPKEFWLSVESGNRYLWVVDDSNPQKEPSQQTYNANLSTTSKFIRDNFSTQSGETLLSGKAYEDTANFGFDFRQSFGSITQIESADPTAEFQLDGVLGLAWGPFGDDPQNDHLAPIVNLLSLYPLPEQLYSMWIGGHKTPSQAKSVTGLITLGDLDDFHCKVDNIFYVPLEIGDDSSYMLFKTDGFKISNESQPYTGAQAYLDTGSPVIQVTIETFALITSALNPTFNWEQELWTVDCSKLTSLPDWIYTINGRDFSIESRNYAVDISLPDNQCALAMSLSEYQHITVLGLPMLRSYCTTYELIGQKVGFLELK